MTSRELTSGFDVWSRGHLGIAAFHRPTEVSADNFVQSKDTDYIDFPKFKMAAAAILDLKVKCTWHIPARWYKDICNLIRIRSTRALYKIANIFIHYRNTSILHNCM